MSRQFVKLIPKIPLYKRNMYHIPESYSNLYAEKGVIDPDMQKALFFVTQFGGFKFKKIPSYLKDELEFFSTWFKTKNENGFFQFKANSNFISELGDVQIEPLTKSRFKREYYPDKILAENGFSRAEVFEIESLQDKLNDFYSTLRLNIVLPYSGITAEDRIDLSRFNAVPHLQFRPKAGGRLFQSGPGSSYQRISSNLRPFLTINGEKITELDITAATLQFLNVSLEKLLGYSPLSKVGLSEDPYQYFLDKINSPNFKNIHNNGQDDDKEKNKDENQHTSRDDLKNILYTIIYSTLNSQEHNVNRRLRIMDKKYYYSDLKKEFPRFFELMSDLKSKPLADGKLYPAHITINKEESRFAREVLKRGCLEEQFVVLPIHDSFISTKSNGERLERIVRQVSSDFYGYVLPYKYKI